MTRKRKSTAQRLREKEQARLEQALLETADALLAKTAAGVAGSEADNFAGLKNAASILKELKAVIGTEADDREQEARIAGLWSKLPGQAASAAALQVLLPPEAEDWCR